MDHHGAVVNPVQVSQRCAHHQDRQQVGRRRDDLGHTRLDGIEEAVLHQDVLKGVPG